MSDPKGPPGISALPPIIVPATISSTTICCLVIDLSERRTTSEKTITVTHWAAMFMLSPESRPR